MIVWFGCDCLRIYWGSWTASCNVSNGKPNGGCLVLLKIITRLLEVELRCNVLAWSIRWGYSKWLWMWFTQGHCIQPLYRLSLNFLIKLDRRISSKDSLSVGCKVSVGLAKDTTSKYKARSLTLLPMLTLAISHQYAAKYHRLSARLLYLQIIPWFFVFARVPSVWYNLMGQTFLFNLEYRNCK